MRSLIAILFVLNLFNVIQAGESNITEPQIILPVSPPQKVYSRFKTNFSYKHDRGLFLSANLGPQWNQSLQKPQAQGIRFGGKVGLGWFIYDGLALHASTWGQFLESASLIAGGPGIAYIFDGPNIGLDFSFGVGRAFNIITHEEEQDFAETVLATNLAIAKYWWLSPNTSLGLALNSGVYGFTLFQGAFSSVGWNVGLSLAFLVG